MNPKHGQKEFFSVVVPIYNEEKIIPVLFRRITETMRPLGDYEIIAVDDGSCDGTAGELLRLAQADQRIKQIRFSRNFGHQAAISAGLDAARGSAVIIIDGDLQDPPEVIPQMIDQWRKGHQVVYAVRRKRKEGVLKRLAYKAFYLLMRAVTPFPVPLDSGDFSLIDRNVLDQIVRLPEKTRFIRGLRAWVGFSQVGVEYERQGRAHGLPKYTLQKLIGLGRNGIVAFSGLPLRISLLAGVFMCLAALLAALFLVLLKITFHPQVPVGWFSLAVGLLFFAGLQFLFLGIIGEYLSLVLDEVQGRPTYILEKKNNL